MSLSRTPRSLALSACLVAAAYAAGCGGDDESGTSATATATTSGSGGGATTGTGGGDASSGTGGGATTGSGGGGGSADGPFTSLGPTSYEAQTSIAANADGSVVAAWIGFFADTTSAIGVAISRDGGQTFSPPTYLESPGGRLTSNPVVAADAQGRFYVAWLGFRPDFAAPDEHVYLARLDKDASAFGAATLASDDGASVTRDFDKPSLAIDANDDVLLTWADFTGFGSGTPASITFARSTDGTSFTRTTVTSDSSFGNLASLCLDIAQGPTAPLYLVHLGPNGTVVVRKSTDQGTTWPQLIGIGASVVFQDPTCVAKADEVWVAFATGSALFDPTLESPGDAVEVAYSNNGAMSFVGSLSAANAPGQQYLSPRLIPDGAGGFVLAYYEGIVGSPAALFVSTSPNATDWTPTNVGAAGTFTLDRTLASWLGGYLGLAATTAGAHVSFTENSQGKAHIAHAGPLP
jgi:hypothetical protein